jgi:hypothetical protein
VFVLISQNNPSLNKSLPSSAACTLGKQITRPLRGATQQHKGDTSPDIKDSRCGVQNEQPTVTLSRARGSHLANGIVLSADR